LAAPRAHRDCDLDKRIRRDALKRGRRNCFYINRNSGKKLDMDFDFFSNFSRSFFGGRPSKPPHGTIRPARERLAGRAAAA
jgi:hypothetical protein